ncbi:TPA: hypothetical protein MH387_28220, partial [Klebsiella pneumoniae]|nr:hypothetical protein [Klebsiella pneumoniae]HBX5187923.1 hypothetical protein [Klebsiella pneumoniae]HBX5193711.1 hypothetical protein [Klebsiella pneumoniae]HBX5210678.1 hypothetical protein [Klebsiella pneumoniae]
FDVFAGKKSAQIREILISESAWEEMTCLFAPSLTYLHLLIIRIHHYNQSKHNHVINVMLYYIAANCSSDYELMTNRVFRGVDWEF